MSTRRSNRKGKCRLCLSNVDAKLLIDVFQTEKSLANNVLECTGVEVSENDDKGSKICRHCQVIVQTSTEFKIACLQANQVLDNRVRLEQKDWLNEKHKNTLKSLEELIHQQRVEIDRLYTSKICPIEPESIKKEEPGGEFQTVGFEEVVVVAVELDNFRESIAEKGDINYDQNDDDDDEEPGVINLKNEDTNISEILERAKNRALNDRVQCEICNKGLKLNSYEGHLNSHFDINPYTCEEEGCTEVFPSLRKKQDHRRTKHKKEIETPKRERAKGEYRGICVCHLCGKRTSRSLIEDHMNSHTGRKPYSCQVCSKEFHAKFRLRNHQKLMHPKEGEERKKRNYVSPKAPCPICGKQIAVSNMKWHINLHNDYRPYTCPFEGCEKAFACPKNLANHKRNEHIDSKVMCAVCGKEFKGKSNLRVHMSFHNEPSIPCQLCGKLEKNNAMMKQHMLTHSNARPHVCEVCGKNFQIKKTLNIHMRTHLNIKPYKCEMCDQAFTYNCLLKNHKEKYHQIFKIPNK